MTTKPRLGFWQLWNMSFGYVGIQFGFALQTANVTRIFETLGAKVDAIPILWVAAPVAGLIIQPLIGHMSDKTWTRIGRRKPYFLVGAVLSSLALFAMPYSSSLWIAAGMLWIMDASINVTMQPFRAFIGDMLPDDQRTQGFAMQTFFIGLSSVVASASPWLLTNWLHIANTAPAGVIPPSVVWSFCLGGIAFLAAVGWTVATVREYSPEELEDFNASNTAQAAEATALDRKSCVCQGLFLILAGAVFSYGVWALDWYAGLYILSGGALFYGLLQLTAAARAKRGKIGGMVEIVADLKAMPETMKQLALVTMLTWFALYALFIYTTSAVTSFHFHSSDPTSVIYNEGANWVGILMAVYNGVAALVAFLLPVIAKRIGRVATHSVCLVVGGLGFISMYLIKDPTMLLASMIAIGIAWASVLTIPYAILSSAVSHRKMGVYMGMFNLFLVIPQIIAAAVLGLLVKTTFGGQAIYAIVLGGGAMVISGLLMVFVKDGKIAAQNI
jgi:maltose/moltooligosaccharide transporter